MNDGGIVLIMTTKTLQQIKSYAQKRGLPLIPIDANDISIINEPKHFYKCILDHILLAKKRLALSSLYIGAGPKEKAIVEAIRQTKLSNDCLKVHLVLDANRATRQDKHGQSSVTVLNSILGLRDIQLSLFDTSLDDSLINRWLSQYQKWNELSSTFHSKLLIFDNNVIVTGANLSEIYFEKRKDRYIIFKNSQQLSDYLYNLLSIISQSPNTIKDSLHLYNSNYESHDIETDTYVIPLNHFELAGIREKEEFLTFLDSILPPEARTYMSSGYFNPSPVVNKLRLDSIILPSEVANGFHAGGGLLRYIPRLYTAFAKEYLDYKPKCDLFIFRKPDWSYHAKGIWYEGLSDIYIHIIGSSNYNYRSSFRDFETQLIILTRNKNLIEKLKNERLNLWQDSSAAEANDFKDLNWIYRLMAKILRSFL